MGGLYAKKASGVNACFALMPPKMAVIGRQAALLSLFPPQPKSGHRCGIAGCQILAARE